MPKKIIAVSGDEFTVEDTTNVPNAKKQIVKSIIDVKKGDIVFTQNGIIIQKVDKDQFEEINNILKTYKKNE